jgi:hypothetical protein
MTSAATSAVSEISPVALAIGSLSEREVDHALVFDRVDLERIDVGVGTLGTIDHRR